MAPKPNDANRIEVDLKLLQSAELEKLRDFNDTFGKHIQTLSDAVSGFAQQVANASFSTGGGTGGWPGYGPGYRGQARPSGVAGPTIAAPRSTAHRTPGETGRSRQTYEDVLDERRARMSAMGRGARFSFADPNLNEYERAQFTLGGFGEPTMDSMFRFMSYLSGRHAYRMGDPSRGESADQAYLSGRPGSRAMAWASGGFGAAARGLQYGQQVGALFGGLARQGGRLTNIGVGNVQSNAPYAQIGMSGGNKFLGEAWQQGKVDWMKNTWAGIRHFGWGKDEEEVLKSGFYAQGFDPDKNEQMLDNLRDSIRKHGYSTEGVTQMMTSTLRYGDKNAMEDFRKVLDDVAKSAVEAGYNTELWRQGIVALSQQINQTTGLSGVAATSAAKNLASATGIAGDRVAGLQGSTLYNSMALAAGVDPVELVRHPELAAQFVGPMLARSMGAKDMEDLMTNPAAQRNFAMMKLLAPQELEQLTAGMDNKELSLLHLRVSEGMSQDDAKKYIDEHGAGVFDVGEIKSTKVQIDFTPEAKGWLREVKQTDPVTSNRRNNARSAVRE